MVRLKDIARQAGVSVMTVSKALRDAHDIAPGTKTRIKLLAQQLGYVPDSIAQGLRTRTSKLFGLVVPSAADPFFVRVIAAIQERAYELGYDVLLGQTMNIPEREEACILRFLARRVGGLLIAPVYRLATESRAFQEIRARDIPTVLLGPPAPFCSQFTAIEADDLGASAMATQHLLELGHKRIAFLAGPLASPWATQRLEGYRRALRTAGLEIDDKLVFQAGNTIDDGAAAAAQLLNERVQFTGVQAVNDLVAFGCASALRQQGLGIPADVSVVGFGNVFLAHQFTVPLTTIRQPKYRLGNAAVAALNSLLRGKAPEIHPLPAELIIRASSGTAPAVPA